MLSGSGWICPMEISANQPEIVAAAGNPCRLARSVLLKSRSAPRWFRVLSAAGDRRVKGFAWSHYTGHGAIFDDTCRNAHRVDVWKDSLQFVVLVWCHDAMTRRIGSLYVQRKISRLRHRG
jgi:hypothetical protein